MASGFGRIGGGRGGNAGRIRLVLSGMLQWRGRQPAVAQLKGRHMSITDPTQHPRIHCAACQKVLVIDPALLEEPMFCIECGADIPVEAYPNLTKIRADLTERRRLAKVAAERARVAAERQHDRERRRLTKAIAGARKTARRRTDAIQALREYRANLKFSEKGPVVASVILVTIGLLLFVVGAEILSAAQSAIHEIEAGVASIVGAVFLVGGILTRYVAFAAHAITTKLELIHEAIQPHAPDARHASSLAQLDSSSVSGQEGTGTPVQS